MVKLSQALEKIIVPSLTLVLGLAICSSTSIMTVAYIVLLFAALFTPEFLSQFKKSLSNKFVIGALVFYFAFCCGLFWTQVNLDVAIKMPIRIIGFGLAPFIFCALQINKSANILVKGFLISATLSVVLSIISRLFHHPVLYGIREPTWVIFHGHILHNAFASIAAIFFLCYVFDSRYTRSNRWVFALCFILCAVDILFVVPGRTGQIMLPFMSVVFILLRFKLRGFIVAILALLIILPSAVFISPTLRSGIQGYNSDVEKYKEGNVKTSMGLRREFHKNSIALIKQNPIIGHGTGSFASSYQHYTGFTDKMRSTVNPHCDVLWVGVELGIFGIFCFVFMLLMNVYSMLQLPRTQKYIGLTLLAGYLISSVENSFFIDNVTGLTYIFLTIALITSGRTHEA